MARYELHDRIAKGSIAEIFRGTAIAGSGFEKTVAIKRILPHLSQDKHFIELLIEEAKILSDLQHRNIVQIYDVGLGDDQQYFLVMEFVDGMDLKPIYNDLFSGRKFPAEIALHICAKICEALEYAHNAKDNSGAPLGLVHRDVSPSNVLLSRSGEVKLTDFGMAKRVGEVTGHGEVRGQYAYISPEQASNIHVDVRSDVYSVGILLYELICGKPLFSNLADFEALREVRAGRIQYPATTVSGVDPALGSLIMKALQKSPSQRFQTAGEFGAAMRNYRYSQDDTFSDPTTAIANLVLREINNRTKEQVIPEFNDEDDWSQDGTVVRISTVVGFNIADLSGSHVPVEENEFDTDTQTGTELTQLFGPDTITKTQTTKVPEEPLGLFDEQTIAQASPFAVTDEQTAQTQKAMSAFDDQLFPDEPAFVQQSPAVATSPPERSLVARIRNNHDKLRMALMLGVAILVALIVLVLLRGSDNTVPVTTEPILVPKDTATAIPSPTTNNNKVRKKRRRIKTPKKKNRTANKKKNRTANKKKKAKAKARPKNTTRKRN